jgi:serine/threonine-protein kinase
LAIKTGDIVGPYKVLDLVGSGGMGTVYKVEHLITKRIEAMKVLAPGVGSALDDVLRFEREIEVQARLQHPNIVALYNAVRDGQSFALIMEYVVGESLRHILDQRTLPLRTAVNYACQVLTALAYAHDKGVIHRDVTPANIIVTPDGTVKLMDFGIAFISNDLRLTGAGVPLGSAWYMSPEQVRAAGVLDRRTDLYAVGAVLHEMLTGRKLFEAEGAFAVMRAQTETVPQPPSAFNPGVPASLDRAVARSLAKVPTARFQTADEFRQALEAVLPAGPADVEGLSPSEEDTICRESIPAADPEVLPRHPRLPRPRARIAPLLAAMLALGGILISRSPSHAPRVVAPPHASPSAVLVPAAVSPPPSAVVLQSPEPPNADPAPEVITHSAKRTRPAVTPAESRQGVDKRAFNVKTNTPAELSPEALPLEPRQSAVQSAVDVAPSPRPDPTSGNSSEPGAVAGTEQAKPQRKGNRLFRELARINPFRKRGTVESKKAAVSEVTAK